MSASIEITPELMAGFLDEAPEYLEMLDAGLMEFEQQAGSSVVTLDAPQDRERMNDMFRAAHSLKGLAAAFGFEKIKELTHHMETLFDQVRMGKLSLAAESFETLFKVFDHLKALVTELTDETAEPVCITDILEALQRLHSPEETPTTESPGTTAESGADVASATNDAAPHTGDAAPMTEDGVSITDDASLPEIFQDSELAAIFIETSAETLEELTQGLLKLEDSPHDVELLNAVFRCAHNIKGASGAAGLSGMNSVTHRMETVFDHLRNERLTLNDELMAVLFHTTDRLRGVVDALRGGTLEDLSDEDVDEELGKWTDVDAASNATPPMDQIETVEGASGGDDTNLRHDHMTVSVSFPDGFDEAPIQAFLIYNRLGDIGNVISTQPDIDDLTGDSEVAEVTFHVDTDADPEEVEKLISTYKVKRVSVRGAGADNAGEGSSSAPIPACPPESPALETPALETPTPETPSPKTATAETPTPEPSHEVPGTQHQAPSPVAKPPQTSPTANARRKPSAKKGGKTEKSVIKTGETLRVDQERLDQLMNLGGELVINKARFIQIHSRFREVFDGKNRGYLVEEITERLARLRDRVDGFGDSQVDSREQHDLARELAQLSEGFAPICSLVNRVHEARSTMHDFDEALHALDRVSDGLQKGIMGTRMVPIGPLFARFRRVVRDISKSNGKEVNLVLRGEQTELDKRMVDELGDPLTHMVRNSVDHGIETPDERRAAGKEPAGTLTLEACHRGNSICIEVTDDGAGINLERVKAKIIERELATAAQVEKMADRDVIQYVLKPGFSTAAKVTDLSGRGMGMDIVLTKIDQLNGSIELDSTPGEGTTVTIKLPLTLAIMTSLVARVGDGVYAIPLEAVAEIITVRREDIQRVQRRDVVCVRERIVPLALFEEVFGTNLPGLQTQSRDRDEMTLVIVGVDGDQTGLIVDELLGQEDVVIKSIAENYRNVKGIAGASIRGDGTVSLILDVVAVMEMAGKAVDTSQPAPVGVEA